MSTDDIQDSVVAIPGSIHLGNDCWVVEVAEIHPPSLTLEEQADLQMSSLCSCSSVPHLGSVCPRLLSARYHWLLTMKLEAGQAAFQ